MQNSHSGSKLQTSSHDIPFPPPRRNILNVAHLERRQLMTRTMRPDIKTYNLISPTSRPQPINMGQLQRSHEKLPPPPSNINLQGVLRPDRTFNIKTRNIKPLVKINHPLYSNPYKKQKEMVDAQQTFKELYGQLLSKMSRLETLTKTFATDGPFHSLRQQTKHYEYLFALALGDPPLLSDPHSRDKFLKKTKKYSDLISKILSKVKIEIHRLSATHEALKLIPRRSPSPNRPNDHPTTSSPRNLKSSLKLSSTSITQVDMSLSMRAKRSTSQKPGENDRTNREDDIITPKPKKGAALQHSKFQSLPEIPCSPEVEPLIKAKEDLATERKKSIGALTQSLNRHQSNASKESKKTEEYEEKKKEKEAIIEMALSDGEDNNNQKASLKMAFTEEVPLQNPFYQVDPQASLPEEAVSPEFNPPIEEQEPSMQVLNISNSEKGEEEEQKIPRTEQLSPMSDLDPLPLPQPSDFKLQFTRREALLFRKFLESMQLIDFFTESGDNTGVMFTFTDQDQGQRNCSQIQDYVTSYRLSRRTMELAPSLFDDLQNDAQFMKILETVSQIGTYEFDRTTACLRFFTWHEKKLLGIIKQLKNYKDDQKLFQFRYVVKPEDAEILRAIEQIPGVTLFDGLPITNVIRLEELNGTTNEVVMFKSSKKGELQTREALVRKLEGITKEVIGLSDYVLQLLELEDDEKESMNFIKQMEVKYACVIEVKKIIKKDEEIVWEETKEKDEEKTKLKLKIERDTRCNNEMIVYAVRKKEAQQVKSQILAKLEDLEKHKKFFKMPNKTGANVQSQWEYVVNKVGLREHKTDFTIQMQKRLKVLLYASESEKFKGIMIYGEEELQKIAFLELGSQFKLHQLHRVSVPLSSTLAQLLTQKRRLKIAQQIKQEFQSFRAQFMMYISGISKKATALVYSMEAGTEKIKSKLEEYLVLCEHKIRYEVMSEEYFILKDHIPRISLAQDHKVLFYFNNSAEKQQYKVAQFGDDAVWMYGRLTEEGHEEWHRYEKARAEELNNYYSEGQEFFLLGHSNFELPQGHPERWNEQTDESRFRVKRATILKKLDGEEKKKILPPWNLLLRGFPKDMTQVKQTLATELEELSKRSTFYDVQHKFKLSSMHRVEREYGVQIEEHEEGKKIRIIGVRRDEAMRALLKSMPMHPSRSFNQEGDYTVALEQESDEYKKQAALFKEQMRYSKALQIEKIERIEQPRQRHRYQREREMMEASMSADAFKDSERTLFQALPPRNLDDIQNPHHLRGNLFSQSPRYFWDAHSSAKQEVVVVQVLLGLRYRAAKQECGEGKQWRVPPKIIQETFCLESDEEGEEGEPTQRRNQSDDYDPDAELNQILAQDDSRFLSKPLNKSQSLITKQPVNVSEYYDSVELLTEKGQAFVVFHQNYALPQYLITYTLHSGSHALSARNGSKNSARSSFSLGSARSVKLA